MQATQLRAHVLRGMKHVGDLLPSCCIRSCDALPAVLLLTFQVETWVPRKHEHDCTVEQTARIIKALHFSRG